MSLRIAALTLLTLSVVSCAAERTAFAPEVRVGRLPPEKADILEALIRSESVPLTIDPFCIDIAGASEVKTIGGYVSGLLVTHRRGGWNSVHVDVEEDYPNNRLWAASALFISGDKQSPNIWGVQFRISRSDGLVLKDSFRCFTLWF